jgi:hypothetical protein
MVFTLYPFITASVASIDRLIDFSAGFNLIATRTKEKEKKQDSLISTPFYSSWVCAGDALKMGCARIVKL